MAKAVLKPVSPNKNKHLPLRAPGRGQKCQADESVELPKQCLMLFRLAKSIHTQRQLTILLIAQRLLCSFDSYLKL